MLKRTEKKGRAARKKNRISEALQLVLRLRRRRDRPAKLPGQVDAVLLAPLLPQRPKVLLHAALHLVRQHDGVLDVQVAKVVVAVAVLVQVALAVDGHALAPDRLDRQRLHDLAAPAAEPDDVAVEVRDVARPVAHPGFAQREHLLVEQILALAAEEGAVGALLVAGAQLGLLLAQDDDQVARDPVWALVGLVLEDDARALVHAGLDRRRHGHLLAHDPVAVAHGARLLDRLALAAALVAVHLHLLEHAGREHVLLDHHAAAAAFVARVDLAVRGAGPLARVADELLLDGELHLLARVEVAQRHAEAHLHVRAFAVAGGVPEAAATEEAGEQIERVVGSTARAAALAMLFEALVAILVVDLARGGRRQDLVRLGDVDELFLRGFVSSGISVRYKKNYD